MEEAITFACQECGKGLTLPGDRGGHVETCPHCGSYVDVPRESDPRWFRSRNSPQKPDGRRLQSPIPEHRLSFGSNSPRSCASRIFQQCMPPYPHCFAQVRRATIFSVIRFTTSSERLRCRRLCW